MIKNLEKKIFKWRYNIIEAMKGSVTMNIIVSGQHLKLTDALREYAIMKCRKVEKYLENVSELKLTLSVENTKSKGPVHKASAVLYASGKTINVESEDTSLYSALDELVDILSRQARKYKEMMKDKK